MTITFSQHVWWRGVALITIAIGVLSQLGCASVSHVKEPAYRVIDHEGDYELRAYGERVVAETEVEGDWDAAGNEGFRRLAGYIFGKNKTRAKIAMTAPVAQRTGDEAPAIGESRKIPMTAPVAQRKDGDRWTVSFTMPEGESLASLPTPDDPRVQLRMRSPETVAVVRFSGRWTSDRMEQRAAALREWVVSRRLRTSGAAEVNRYDPPFMPWFMRRNEVWLNVDEESWQP